MIGIIDYGRGNIRSVFKAFKFLGLEVKILSSKADFSDVSRLVLPGVGSFGDGMNQLNTLDFSDSIKKAVNKGIPFLGICLGLQLLFEESEESPGISGLSLLKGKVEKFQGDFKIPQMGWNTVNFHNLNSSAILENIPQDTFFYFVHSYKVVPQNKETIWGETDYFGKYVSAVQSDNLLAVQFHPEKSQDFGLQLLKNWGCSC